MSRTQMLMSTVAAAPEEQARAAAQAGALDAELAETAVESQQGSGVRRGDPDGVRASTPDFGDVIADKYRVEHVLGAGGMGAVLSAQDMGLNRPVAIKVMLPRASRSPGAIARFLREAQAAAAIRSRHVARIMDVGTLDSGLPFLVMERLEGSPLDEVLKRFGRLPVRHAVDYVLQACEAIAEAHALGIVHRDLKPANLFLASCPGGAAIKVLDFGVSKVLDAQGPVAAEGSLTKTNMTLGSPSYMSPEQVRSPKNVDARTDVWALGVILYELLTGRLPFAGETMFDVFMAITADTPQCPRDHRAELPAALGDVVMRCLEKDLSRRMPSAADLAQALRPFGSVRSDPLVRRAQAHRDSAAPPPMPGREDSCPSQPPSAPRREDSGPFEPVASGVRQLGPAPQEAAAGRGSSAPPAAAAPPRRAAPAIPPPPAPVNAEAPASTKSRRGLRAALKWLLGGGAR
ncbi:MAG: serine/threonine protein kinase [Polyangiaceae bacterium]|nr:serine/threonine protein kinase [Polyangiaceae bacterium]